MARLPVGGVKKLGSLRGRINALKKVRELAAKDVMADLRKHAPKSEYDMLRAYARERKGKR